MIYRSIILIVLLLLSCKQGPVVNDLTELNGYWEIEKVVFPDGNSREYSISTTIDYIYFEENKGYRKKVKPKLDGSFITSDDADYFKINDKNGTFIMSYENELSSREEIIQALGGDILILVNEEGIAYHYKRFQSIQIKSGQEPG